MVCFIGFLYVEMKSQEYGGLIGWLVIPSFIVHLKKTKNKKNIPNIFNDFYELIIPDLLGP